MTKPKYGRQLSTHVTESQFSRDKLAIELSGASQAGWIRQAVAEKLDRDPGVPSEDETLSGEEILAKHLHLARKALRKIQQERQ